LYENTPKPLSSIEAWLVDGTYSGLVRFEEDNTKGQTAFKSSVVSTPKSP